MRQRPPPLLHRFSASVTVLGALAILLSCSRGAHAPSPATAFAARTTDAKGGPALYAAVHVDHLQAGGLWRFTEARRRWVDALSRAATTDGRGLYMQTGDSGFLSLRPLHSMSDLDRQSALITQALAAVDPAEQRKYDGASDALLAPPHRNEIWRFDADLSFGTSDPMAALTESAWGKMTVEELDPTPAGEDYEKAWKEIREALTKEEYPLVRVAYWSRYGSGNLVTLWLSKSQTEFLRTPSVDAVVTRALGPERALPLLARLHKAVLASDSVDIVPRLDLSSKAL